jgi:hypothetical protein
MPKATTDPLEGGQEITSKMIGFNKVGDWVKGTYTSKKRVDSKNSKDADGKINLYELKVESGEFHPAETGTDDNGNKVVKLLPPVTVKAGDYYQIWGGKSAIDDGFKRVALGTLVGLRLTETQPSKTKGNSPFKVFKFVSFGLDPNYMGESSQEEVLAADNDLPEGLK